MSNATDPPAVQGYRRTREWHQVSRGLHRRLDARDLDAWQLALPPSGRFTHLTAAAERGWWLPTLPEGLPVWVAVDPSSRRPERDGLLARRTAPLGACEVRGGLRLDSAVDVLINCARDLGLLDVVILLDAALHAGDCALDEVRSAASERRRGAPMLRLALDLCDERSESLFETLLRVLHVVAGFEVEPQRRLFSDGVFVARGDLWLVGTNAFPEYDGAHHLTVDQQRDDLDRIRRLQAAGCERRGYTSKEVLRQAAGILRDAERSTGRQPSEGALGRWNQLLRDSLMTAAGRTRLLRRLDLVGDEQLAASSVPTRS